MLYAPEALEAAVHHDGHACAQGFTFLHAGETQEETALFLFTNKSARHTPSDVRYDELGKNVRASSEEAPQSTLTD